MSKIHNIKCITEFFTPLFNGVKTFEIRWNDRDYQPNDELLITEIKHIRVDPQFPKAGCEGVQPTGRILHRKISYVLTSKEFAGLFPGFVALGLQKI